MKELQEDFLLNILKKLLSKPLVEFIEKTLLTYIRKFLEKPMNRLLGGLSESIPVGVEHSQDISWLLCLFRNRTRNFSENSFRWICRNFSKHSFKKCFRNISKDFFNNSTRMSEICIAAKITLGISQYIFSGSFPRWFPFE